MPEEYKSMKTHCVGRSQVEIPEKFHVSRISTGTFRPVGFSSDESSFEILVEETEMNTQQFSKKLLLRRSELNMYSSKTVRVLRLEEKLSDTAELAD